MKKIDDVFLVVHGLFASLVLMGWFVFSALMFFEGGAPLDAALNMRVFLLLGPILFILSVFFHHYKQYKISLLISGFIFLLILFSVFDLIIVGLLRGIHIQAPDVMVSVTKYILGFGT